MLIRRHKHHDIRTRRRQINSASGEPSKCSGRKCLDSGLWYVVFLLRGQCEQKLWSRTMEGAWMGHKWFSLTGCSRVWRVMVEEVEELGWGYILECFEYANKICAETSLKKWFHSLVPSFLHHRLLTAYSARYCYGEKTVNWIKPMSFQSSVRENHG